MKHLFSPGWPDDLPEELVELFRNLELKLLEEICSRLVVADTLNEVTLQDIRALRSHGIDLQVIENAIMETTGIGEKMLTAIIDDVVERNAVYYAEVASFAQITLPEYYVAREDIESIRRQTMGEYRNITQSLGFLVDGGRTKLPAAQGYQWALDNAEMQVQSGAFSYGEAISNAVRQLATSGVKFVDYESGHTDQVDVAVRRAVLTGINQVCDKYTTQSAEFLETRYYEISAHSGARDICRDPYRPWQDHKSWQGRVYYLSVNGEPDPLGKYKDLIKTTGYGEVDGLTGANCRHHRHPWVEGMERTYSDEDLEHIDDGLGCEFEGRKYSPYEATQKQRQIERTIRKQKRLKAAASAAGNEEDARAAGAKLRRLYKEYREFSKAAGLPEQRERMKVLYT